MAGQSTPLVYGHLCLLIAFIIPYVHIRLVTFKLHCLCICVYICVLYFGYLYQLYFYSVRPHLPLACVTHVIMTQSLFLYWTEHNLRACTDQFYCFCHVLGCVELCKCAQALDCLMLMLWCIYCTCVHLANGYI